MQLHPNAKLCPAQRQLLVRRVRKDRWSITEAAEAAGVSRPTAYKWLRRFDAGDHELEDRSARPQRIARKTPARLVQRIEQRRRRKRTAYEISQRAWSPDVETTDWRSICL